MIPLGEEDVFVFALDTRLGFGAEYVFNCLDNVYRPAPGTTHFSMPCFQLDYGASLLTFAIPDDKKSRLHAPKTNVAGKIKKALHV